ncbi:MAG: transposase [Prevotella sp.]|nr:transposase [Prevotella sp.]
MSRKSRQTSPTGMYHVMLRGINRQDIFLDNEDYWKFIKILHQQVNPKDELGAPLPPKCYFYAYCLMPNHIHLLIKLQDESIGSIIKSIGIAYASYFNRRYERVGHLFQDRFRSEPVGNMEYFLTLIRYIHQNPVAGGLTSQVKGYPWSSWIEYEHPEKCKVPVCNTKAVTSRISLCALQDLVNELLPKSAIVLEFGKEDRDQLAEEKLRQFLFDQYEISDPQVLGDLPESERIDILQAAHHHGFSIRRLALLTGLTPYVIHKSIR